MTKRKIRVFIASPGDLADERQAFREAVDHLNSGFADGANVEFESLGWEDTLASTGRRNQGVINEEIDKCDVFILTMYRRWGQHAPDAAPYSSYTEEEFHRALELWKATGTPEIFVFFKRVDAASEADAGPHLKQVIDFRKQLESTRQVLYHYYDDLKNFKEKVDRHLRAYVKGELPKTDQNKHVVILPNAALAEVEQAKKLAEQKSKEAENAHDQKEKLRLQFEAMQLQMAKDAAKLSREGKIEFAREKMTQLISETTNFKILYLAYEFFYRTGDLDSAFHSLEKWLALSGEDNHSRDTALAYGNLGNLHKLRGDLTHAEKMYRRALSINEALGYQKGAILSYICLGAVSHSRGESDAAEKFYEKALSIGKDLGSDRPLVSIYSNLGMLYQSRGDLANAKKMYEKAIDANFSIGRQEGLAIAYGNIGTIYQAQNDLDTAEEMYKKSLVINESLGRKRGVSSSYDNLGSLYQARGDLDKAEDMYTKAMDICEELGHKEGMVYIYKNLEILYQARGDLDKAEDMSRKASMLFFMVASSNTLTLSVDEPVNV